MNIITNHTNMKGFVSRNRSNVAILIFLVGFFILHNVKPISLYTDDGGFREFGIGYRHTTVVPIWFVSIIWAILSYLVVLYYLAYM